MIVLAIIGGLAALAIPNFLRARQTSQINACINNLRQIDGAVEQWALENRKAASDNVSLTDVSAYLGRGTIGSVVNTDIKCPTSGTYAVTDCQSKPTCSVGARHVLN